MVNQNNEITTGSYLVIGSLAGAAVGGTAGALFGGVIGYLIAESKKKKDGYLW